MTHFSIWPMRLPSVGGTILYVLRPQKNKTEINRNLNDKK